MSEQQGEIAVGGLYAVRNEDESFGIYYVLAVDGFGVSLPKGAVTVVAGVFRQSSSRHSEGSLALRYRIY